MEWSVKANVEWSVVRVRNIDLLNESNLPALIPGSCVFAWNI